MTKQPRQATGAGEVKLSELVSAGSGELTRVHHLVPAGGVIRDLALISDIEDIIGVGPDTLVVLSAEASTGGWMVSAALRYAWERRAAALVVPEQSLTKTAVSLARRLGVSLLSTDHEATRTALDLALRIGLTRSGQVARLQQFSAQAARINELTELIGLISAELGGRRVLIETAGSIVFSVSGDEVELDITKEAPTADSGETDDASAAASDDDRADDLVAVEVEVAPTTARSDLLRVFVDPDEREYAERVLEAAASSVRALTAEFRLSSLTSSLPALTMASLTGTRRFALISDAFWPDSGGDRRWPLSGTFIAVCVLAGDRDASAVHQVWHAGFPDVPLARIDTGWLALLPTREPDGADGKATVRGAFAAYGRLDIGVGISAAGSGSERVATAVQEAWLAARLALGPRSAADGRVLEFSAIPLSLGDRILPEELAIELARTLFPRLLADAEARVIVETVVAVLACRGSVSGAADRLGVHRNTLHSRLRRAAELGVPLSDPETTLSVHLIFAALLDSGIFPGQRPTSTDPELISDLTAHVNSAKENGHPTADRD